MNNTRISAQIHVIFFPPRFFIFEFTAMVPSLIHPTKVTVGFAQP
jgi:hypothetical protein